MVGGLAFSKLSGLALFRQVRAQKKRFDRYRDIELLLQLVDSFQADVAPGSNIVVPNGNIDRFVVLPVGVGCLGHLDPPAGRDR